MITLSEVRSRIQRGAKSVFNDIGFALDADGMSGSRSSGRRYYVPGTSLNWDNMTGDLWACPAVQACQNWVSRNLPQAPPQVVRTNYKGETEPRPDHPLTELLTNPNELYDYSALMMGTLLSWFLNGNAFWAIERGSYQQPTELWWVPHHLIRPKKRTGSKTLLPDYYEYRSGGTIKQINPNDIVQLRFGIDPYNYLLGMSPLASVSRDVYSLQQAITYTARTMKNSGMVGGVVMPKDPNAELDIQDFVSRWQAKVVGDNSGELIGVSGPVDLTFPAFTPEAMTLETLPDRPEADVCALYGVAAQVAGLHVGRLSKTYANMKEAREASWEECGIPTLTVIGSQAGKKLLPMVSPKARTETLTFDFSQIRPLQPDLDALFARADHSWQLGLIDRAEWKRMVLMTPAPDDEGLYYYDLFPLQGSEVGGQGSDTENSRSQNGAGAARNGSGSARNGTERAQAA